MDFSIVKRALQLLGERLLTRHDAHITDARTILAELERLHAP